ncbi:ATP-binding protein [Candidatus Marinimicrobia bacterium MT.SAG.4]|nr:ATP-binding protein [Candidatus Marinimicrobia bacterium MT.SAG.4]
MSAISNKPAETITLEDIQQLLDTAAPESKIIEYKEKLNLEKPEDRIEFAYDVSSFANTDGGHLIYGVAEDKGVPVDIPGFAIENADKLHLKIENIFRDSIDPRLPDISIPPPIPLENDNFIQILYIPPSWKSPHMVKAGNRSRFYARNNSGKFQLDVHQIRDAFLKSETVDKKIEKFIQDRISGIINDDLPIDNLNPNAKIILHLIPTNSFSVGEKYNPADLFTTKSKILPLSYSRYYHNFSSSNWPNLEGMVSVAQQQDDQFRMGYLQIYRNGIFEAVDSDLLSGRYGTKGIPEMAYELMLVEGVGRYLKLMKTLGVEPPILIVNSLIGVKDMYLSENRDRQINKHILLLPQVKIESYDVQLPKIMKPIFDRLYNAGGIHFSPYYDENNNWQLEDAFRGQYKRNVTD